MKIWFLADTHFGMKNDDSVLEDCYRYYNEILIPYMKENVKDDDILVHLGDVFDNRTYLGIREVYYAFDVFEKFSKIFSDIRVCVGNHDMLNKSTTDVTALHGIKYMPNVKVYFKPTWDTICGKKVLFVPWIEDLVEQRSVVKNSNADYVFGHLQISGSIGNTSKGTRVIGDDMPNPKDFKKSQVYAGHMHIRQNFGNVHYVGIPYHKDRSDIGNSKGITILDIETGETEFIENRFSPRYIHESIYDILDEPFGEVKKRWTNNHIDIDIKNSDYLKNVLDPLRDALDNCFKSFNAKTDNSEVMVSVDEEKVMGEMKSSSDVLNDYVDALDNIDDSERDEIKDALKEFNYKL